MEVEQLKCITLLSDIAEQKDEDFFSGRLRDKWDELEEDQRKGLYKEILHNSKNDRAIDLSAAIGLKKILTRHELKELSLTQWKNQKDELLKEAKEKPTLILFDQDMTGDGGKDNERICQIAALAPKDDANDKTNACYGLLTHIGEIDEEPYLWQKLSKDNGVPQDRFVYISKKRLDKPYGFASMLKLTALSAKCAFLKTESKKIYTEAIEKAGEEIDKINIYDFEHIVFAHSRDEDIWEPDTLFRLFGLFHRRKTLQLARQNDALKELAGEIRKISQIPIPSKEGETPKHRSWEIQRQELYEEGDSAGDCAPEPVYQLLGKDCF